MQEFFDWIDRLRELTGPPPPTISEQLKRLSAPSPLAFDQSVVRVVDARQEAYTFGRVPGRLSVLAWLDTAPGGQNLDDQALAAQLGAILTLATNRRIQVAASDVILTMEGTTQRTFLPTNSVLDRSLSGPIAVDVRAVFDATLRSLCGLVPTDRDTLGAAIELHYAAAVLFDVDPNAAYALCIGGIERLSRIYGNAPSEWGAWEDAERIDRAFAELELTDTQAERLRKELVKNRHLRLRQTFAGYVVASLSAAFWDIEIEDFYPGIQMEPDGASTFTGMNAGDSVPITRFVPRDVDALRRRLLASYDARSSYVHDGKPASSTQSAVTGLVGQGPDPRAPIQFAGVRAILRSLILTEMTARSSPTELPDVKLITPSGG